MTKHSSLRSRAVLALIACGVAATAATAATSPRFEKQGATNLKFDFTGVTLTDADGTTFTGAVIHASSKLTGGGSAYTVCGYDTANDESYLGQFQQSGVSFTDAAAIEQFCIDNFGARQIR